MHIYFYIGICHIIVNLVLIIHEKILIIPKAFHRYAVLHMMESVTGVTPLPIILCSYGASSFPIITHQRCFQIVASREAKPKLLAYQLQGRTPAYLLRSFGVLLFPIITHQRCFQIVASSGG